MVVEIGGLQSFLLTCLLHLDIVGKGAHLPLDSLQTDQFVEFLIGVTLQCLVDYHTVALDTFLAVFLIHELIFASPFVGAVIIIVEDEFFLFLGICVLVTENHGACAHHEEAGSDTHDNNCQLLTVEAVKETCHIDRFLMIIYIFNIIRGTA